MPPTHQNSPQSAPNASRTPSTSDPRYARQEILPQIGPAGQASLAASTVLVVGLGALGSVAADLLARAGVGHLLLLDRDTVELSNLQRQTLYATPDVGSPKAIAAATRLSSVNPTLRLTPLPTDLNASNILSLLSGVSLILDATDNAQTRYLLNDAAIHVRLPWVYGGAVATTGRVAAFAPARGSHCLRCLFPTPPSPGELPTCDTAGVLNTATATIASLQTTLALRLLLDPAYIPDQLLSIDFWTLRFSSIHLTDPGCPTCCGGALEFLHAASPPVVSLCGRNTLQVLPPRPTRVRLSEIAERWKTLGTVHLTPHILRLHPNPPSQTVGAALFADGRLLLEFPPGTASPPDTSAAQALAQTLYDRWVGT